MRRRVVLLLTTAMTAALVVGLMTSGLASAQSTGANYTVDRSDDPNLTTTPTADDCTAATANDCSLRGAISQANNNDNPSLVDIINFNIPGAGPHTIAPTGTDLPNITEPVTIDGYSQPGSSPNAAAFGTFATLKIVISGASAPKGPTA